MNKIAKVTAFFWIMKICATTLGETAGDLLSMTLNVGYAISSLILISLFLVSVVAQLRSSKFHPLLYWTVILTTSMAGTTMSDFMDRTLGLGYMRGSLILVTCLAAVLMVWRFSEKTLSVNNIQTTKAEIFYWVAILFSNTLGTALGDFLSDNSGLGFLGEPPSSGGCSAWSCLPSTLPGSTGSCCSGSPSFSPGHSGQPSATFSPSPWQKEALTSARWDRPSSSSFCSLRP